jgi:hypothetical protein
VRQIRLEEFYQDGYMQMQEDLEQLALGFSTPPEYYDVTVGDFYKHAVDNLKSTFASLKRVRLEGGYLYRPDDEQLVSFLNDILCSIAKVCGAITVSSHLKINTFYSNAHESPKIAKMRRSMPKDLVYLV